ncbi:MAG TPA: MarR family transcriptional regulator [Pseudobdellovibrionaceae bacterium]|nr:MarR family transcriptional regulator [Pseudobdellovibrionaceae bacterium]
MEIEKQCAKHLLQDLPGLACVIKQAYCPQEDMGFTLQQMRLLSLLQKSAQSTSDLAESLSVSLPAISRMTQMMIDSGWLEKEISKKDRRQIKISLTPMGRSLLKEAQELSLSKLLPQLKNLSQNEKKTILKAFEIIDQLILNNSPQN